MNLQEIENRIRNIAAVQDDPDKAHEMEIRLRCDFIRYVAETAGGPLNAMAWRILALDSISFDPWDNKGGSGRAVGFR